MAESFGAGGPSGSSGILSSTIRSITRQAGDPHDHETRRIEDVVSLSPQATREQSQIDRPIEPVEAANSLNNPGAEKARQARERADAKAEEAQQARDEARTVEANAEAGIEGPAKIGMAAAITIGAPDMVRRFDVNGDERLDQLERENAIQAVQSERSFEQARGGGVLIGGGSGEADAKGETDTGSAVYAEAQAKRAEAAQRYAEETAKAEEARAERIAELEERAARGAEVAAALRPEASEAYARTEELDQPHADPHGIKA